MPSGGEKQSRGQIRAVEWQVALPLGVKAGPLTPAAEDKPQASRPLSRFDMN